MNPPDLATVQALRSDLALQLARFLERSGQSQAAMAKHLAIPQPTLSRIMNGKVAELSLELLIRIAVRAGLPVLLQTGKVPEEAGVFVSRAAPATPERTPSRLAEEAHNDLIESARRMTPEQKLEAHVKHSELVTGLQRADRRGRTR